MVHPGSLLRTLPAFLLTLTLIGCSGGGQGPVTPEPASHSHQSTIAAIVAASPARHIADVQFGGTSILGQAYLYPGSLPGASHEFRIVPAPGAALAVRWSTSAGAFESGSEATGLMVRWTAPMADPGEGRLEARISTPDGEVFLPLRVYVDSDAPDTDQIHPQPTAEVMLFDPNPPAGAANEYEVCENELLITLDQPVGDADDVYEFFASMGTPVIARLPRTSIFRVVITDGTPMWDKIAAYRALSFVQIAEPNHIHQLDIVPNDPSFGQQYCHPLQKAIEAWDVGRGSDMQIVAIMDTGTGRQHPDLAAKVVDGADFVTPQGDGLGGDVLGDGVDNNGRGGIDEGVGHGVHCSGIAAAISNNGVGGAGMAWNTKLMGLRIFPIDGDNGASSSSIIGATNFVRDWNNNPDNEAKIVSCNLSFGGGGFSQTSQNAYTDATNSGCTFAGAAGNSNVNSLHYPSAYENIIAVASVANGDVKSSFSNYGTWVDVSAAGSSIWNTYFTGPPGTANPNTYASLSGTSMACPQVAGLIALIKGNAPDLTPQEVADQIMGTTDPIDDINPSYRGQLGTGRINAFRALTQSFSVELESLNTVTVDDSEYGFARGNRDGIINPGEKVFVRPVVQNVGLRGSNNATFTVEDPTDDFIKFAATQITVSSITRVDGMAPGSGFPLVISPETPDNYEATFDFVVDDASGDGPWNFSFTVRVERDDRVSDVVPVAAGDLTEGIARRPSTNMPFFSLDLTGDNNYLTVKKLTVSLVGSVDPAAISNIRLWADNGNGVFDGDNADRELGLRSYWNTSYNNNFDRLGDPAAKLGNPQDRDVYAGSSFGTGTSVTFRDLRIPLTEDGQVRLFVSASIARSAAADTTVGLMILNESDLEVSEGDSVTGFPWGSATVPIVPSWENEAIFAQAGSSQSWRSKAALDGNGNVYVVYDACCFSDFDIYMRKSSDGGYTWGTEQAIVTNNANDYYPDVATGPDGEVLVSWYNTRHGNNNREIYFKKSTDFAATWGTEVRVTNQTRNGRVPRITYANGATHIVWFDNVTASTQYNVYHIESTTLGDTWQTASLVSNTPTNRVAEEPMIIGSGSTLYAAWFEYVGTFGQPGNSHRVVYNTRPDGGAWGTPRVITPDTELAYGVRITPAPGGRMLAVYHSNRDGDYDIWMQEIEGNTTVREVQIGDLFGEQFFPDIKRRDDGTLDIVWETSVEGTDGNIFHQIVNPDDSLGALSQLSKNSTGVSEVPFLLRDESSGNMWAWWNDSRPSGTKTWFSSLLN